MLYFYIGQTIKQLISNTTWDIPEKKKFNSEDRDFILDTLEFDYVDYVDSNYIEIVSNFIDKTNSGGKDYITITFPAIRGFDPNPLAMDGSKYNIVIDYDSDFMYRIQYHFSGAIIKSDRYSDFVRIYLPFYI